MSINANQITVRHAEDVFEGKSSTEDQGHMVIDGEDVEWWSDAECIWFYEPGNDSDNTVKRFDVSTSIYEDKSSK